jgi:hypothetical protein
MTRRTVGRTIVIGQKTDLATTCIKVVITTSGISLTLRLMRPGEDLDLDVVDLLPSQAEKLHTLSPFETSFQISFSLPVSNPLATVGTFFNLHGDKPDSRQIYGEGEDIGFIVMRTPVIPQLISLSARILFDLCVVYISSC